MKETSLQQMPTVLLQGQGGDPIVTLIMIAGVMVVFYFFMLRPQMQRQKKEKAFRESLKKDDKVVTIGGLYGKIVSIDDKTVLLEVDEGVKLRFERTSIREHQNSGTPAKS